MLNTTIEFKYGESDSSTLTKAMDKAQKKVRPTGVLVWHPERYGLTEGWGWGSARG